MDVSDDTARGFPPSSDEELLGTEAADLADLEFPNDAAGEPEGASLSSKDDPGSAALTATSAQQPDAEGVAEPLAADAPLNAAGGRVLTSDEQLLALFQRARFRRGGKGPGRETGRPATYRAKATKYAKKVRASSSHIFLILHFFRTFFFPPCAGPARARGARKKIVVHAS